MTMKEPSVLEQNVASIVRSVIAFHERFNLLPVDDVYFQIPDNNWEAYLLSQFQSRQGLLMEEVGEVSKALNHGDIDHAVKELIDVLYITIGSLYTIGDQRSESPLNEIIDKNRAKTPETHEMHPVTGKIIRK